jgi:glucose uptake protein
LFIFGGIALVCAAIATNAMAYRGLMKDARASTRGIALSLLCGSVIGMFYPFVRKALIGRDHLGPYTVYFVFTLGALVSNIPLNYAFMRHPVSGSRLSIGDYVRGAASAHAWGVLGGVIWGVGTIGSLLRRRDPATRVQAQFALCPSLKFILG